MKFIVIGNSKQLSEVDVRRECADAAQIIAADGGANYCFQFGIRPHLIVGDLDSISDSSKTFFDGRSEFEVFPEAKDELDIVIAIRRAEERGATKIHTFGWSDDRIDYSLSSLIQLIDLKAEICLWTETAQIHLLNVHHPRLQITGPRKLSIMGLSPNLRLKTQGLRWELDWESLGPRLSQSNEVALEAQIEVFEGSAYVLVERVGPIKKQKS